MIIAMCWTQRLYLYCFVKCFVTYRLHVMDICIPTAQVKCGFLQNKVMVTLTFLCRQPKQHFVAWNPVYVVYWGGVPKQVEVIKDVCCNKCLELTLPETHMDFVSEGIRYSPVNRTLVFRYHTCNKDSGGSRPGRKLGAKFFDNIDISGWYYLDK